MYKLTLIVSLVVLVSFSGSWAADDFITVVPGKYNIKTTTRSNMSPNPQIETQEHCIGKASHNTKSFLPDDENCSASNVKKSGNKITFDFKCTGDERMPAMTGKADASASSSTLSSHFKMTGVAQGQEFSVDTTSEGSRTGSCN